MKTERTTAESLARHSMSWRSFAGAWLLFVAIASIVAWYGWFRPDRAPTTATVAPTLLEEFVPPTILNPGYVGAQVCAACHADRVAEFQETRHFLANCVPRSGRMPAGFATGRRTWVHPDDESLRFEMRTAEDEFQQTAIRETASGEVARSARIAFVYGSEGGNDEVYFTWHGDGLRELPLVWLASTAEWGISPLDVHGSGDFSRDTTIRCVECHNTWFEHVPGSRSQYRKKNAILGVTCEVCHGPGEEHVAFHQRHPQATEPYAVVRPAILERERQMDLCAQCHSNALKHRGAAFGYRPGLPLDDFYFTLRTRHPEDDHVANQTTYLRQSRCFQESDALTCSTCHDPHRPRSAANAGAASCRKCHAAEDCREHDTLPAAVRDGCIGCHMPTRRKIQVAFRTNSDRSVAPVKRFEHRIGIYPEARDAVLLDWYRRQSDAASRRIAQRLAKSIREYWRVESEKLRGEYRYVAAIDACREGLRFAPDPSLQDRLEELLAIQSRIERDLQDGLWHAREDRPKEAIESFERIVEVKPDHATAHAKLGTAYAVIGRKKLALEHLQAATSCDPDDPYAFAMLGWLAYLDGRFEEGLAHYSRAEEVEPFSAQLNRQMGLALARLDRWPEASKRFARAVEIDPNEAVNLVALGQALQRLGKPRESLPYLLRAARLTDNQDLEILTAVAEVLSQCGYSAQAREQAHKALAAGRSSPRGVEPQFERRLREILRGTQ